MQDIRFITLQEVIQVHIFQIESFGGLHGVRDGGLLESAIYAPQATFGGNYLHKDLFAMGAAYAYGVIKNHPFLDGNKRTGIALALLFLYYHDYRLDLTSQELYDLAMSIATSKITPDKVVVYLRKKSVVS